MAKAIGGHTYDYIVWDSVIDNWRVTDHPPGLDQAKIHVGNWLWRGLEAGTCRWPLRPEGGHQLMAIKKPGPQTNSHKERNSSLAKPSDENTVQLTLIAAS